MCHQYVKVGPNGYLFRDRKYNTVEDVIIAFKKQPNRLPKPAPGRSHYTPGSNFPSNSNQYSRSQYPDSYSKIPPVPVSRPHGASSMNNSYGGRGYSR